VEPLDNWVWRALTGPHRDFSEGRSPALRYQPDVTPFAGLPDELTPDAWSALAELLGRGGSAVLIRGEVGPLPAGWTEHVRLTGVQMIGPAPPPEPGSAESTPSPSSSAPATRQIIRAATSPSPSVERAVERSVEREIEPSGERLTAADVPDMLELIAAAQPGPFAPRTIELGTYLGVRHDGRLIAMAGERMRIDGYTEVSAVCTHLDHRRQGLSGLLIDQLVVEIHRRGDTPFLHVTASNAAAISRYRSLGFEERRRFEGVALSPPA
jgi:ribosomal protein S18 acetylase RimI-like enzyme